MLFIIIMLLTSIPLTAILSNAWLKSRDMKVKSGLSDDERKLLKQLITENEQLKSRLENLEIMVADIDLDVLKSTTSKQIKT